MKKTILFLVVTLFFPIAAWAADHAGLSASWQAERDAASIKVVRLWLARAPKPVLDREVFQLVDREIKLSIMDPDARLLVSDSECKNQELPVFLLIRMLREEGIDLHPATFFAGKQFCLPWTRGGKPDGKK